MDASTFDWDDANIAHIAEHDVTPDEAEEALNSDPVELGLEIRHQEERLSYVGQTFTDRILVVVTTMRGDKIRVVTCFPANRLQRTVYLRTRGSSIQ